MKGLKGKALFEAAAAEGMTAEKFIDLYKKGSIMTQFPGQYSKALLTEIQADAKAGIAAARTAMKLLIDNQFTK